MKTICSRYAVLTACCVGLMPMAHADAPRQLMWEDLAPKLEASENALQSYKEQMQAASLEERQNVVVDKLKELSSKVTEAKSQRIMHETAFKQIEALGTNASALMVLPAVANDPAIVGDHPIL